MNSNKRREVEKLKAEGLTPKQAYDKVKLLKLRGKRKCDKQS